MEAIRTEEYKGYTIEVYYDECGDSPREWDNMGKMVCFHKRYDLGDKHSVRHEDFSGWNEMGEYLKKELKAVIVLPLFLYDHSGISISVGSFVGKAQHADWDSGQVGFIYVSREQVLKEYSVKRISKKILKRVDSLLRSEVKTYNDYLTGQVFGYKLLDKNDEEVESCWGYYGETEELINECKGNIDRIVLQNVKNLNNTKAIVLG